MLLSKWLSIFEHHTTGDAAIKGLENNSQHLKPGDAFLAYPGAVVDGRQFIQQAIDKGASAIIYEAEGIESFKTILNKATIPVVALHNLATSLGAIAARFYDYPASKLDLVGVTGTNGKTTTAYQLSDAYSHLGSKSAYIGTLGEGLVPHLNPLANTTPDGLCLQKLFHSYVLNGTKKVCMEVSSHALATGRVAGLPFHQAIFTNLTRDHLDFHQTMANYQEAKASLFATPELKVAIINGDDAASRAMAQKVKNAAILFYGMQEKHDIYVKDYQITTQGTIIHIQTPWGKASIKIRALGEFNIYNALGIIGSLCSNGYSLTEVAEVLSSVAMVPGRMEIISQSPCVIVDYAHTPDALENVLKTVKKIHSGKVIVVFGCGGNRDQGKRPLMGKVASLYADLIILTNDNPRDEDPNDIIGEIEKGIVSPKKVQIFPDRRLAIEKALQIADKSDLILVAGKGHEAYQQIGKTRLVFSDQDVIRTTLERVTL